LLAVLRWDWSTRCRHQPLVIGGRDAPGAVSGRGVERMAQALRLRDVVVERLGEDVLVTGYPLRNGDR
jgi:diaminohydroxyphosphoribosylaminopyrimidine deaminase/5-amino-6-(5-phosphoribosylamino)uracil reductase